MRFLPLLLLAFLLPLRADMLANSNFADGRAHWKGDAQDPDAADSVTLAPSASSNSTGVIIKLKKDKWRKIFQNFTIRGAKLYYTVTFQLSPDYKLTSHNWADTSSADFTDVPGFYEAWSMSERAWCLIITGNDYTSKILEPNLKKTGEQQTLTGRLSDLTDGTDATLVLAFPPGEGTITLFKLSLSTTDPTADPNANPLGSLQ